MASDQRSTRTPQCRERLRPGEYGVFTARAGEQRCWHRACFACQACGQALINLIYFYHDGRLYCGRHHAELLRPRCPACDQVQPRGEGLEGVCPGSNAADATGHLFQYHGVGNRELGTSLGTLYSLCSDLSSGHLGLVAFVPSLTASRVSQIFLD